MPGRKRGEDQRGKVSGGRGPGQENPRNRASTHKHNKDGVFTLTKGPKGEYIASLIFGHEAPDSPMAGAHAIGIGNSAADAVFGMLHEMGKV